MVLTCKVLIVIPCFNESSKIGDCLKSILNQTFEDWHCLIVDACSSDSTVSIVENLIKNDKRFSLFASPQETDMASNWTQAINIGLTNYDPEFFCLLAADDKFGHVDYISHMLSNFYEESFNFVMPQILRTRDESMNIGLTLTSNFSSKNAILRKIKFYFSSYSVGNTCMVYAFYESTFFRKVWSEFDSSWKSDYAFDHRFVRKVISKGNGRLFQNVVYEKFDKGPLLGDNKSLKDYLKLIIKEIYYREIYSNSITILLFSPIIFTLTFCKEFLFTSIKIILYLLNKRYKSQLFRDFYLTKN
jgi:glycosyltransferase involved in cell wall biosynthesis